MVGQITRQALKSTPNINLLGLPCASQAIREGATNINVKH
jgi:hypothetical protein